MNSRIFSTLRKASTCMAEHESLTAAGLAFYPAPFGRVQGGALVAGARRRAAPRVAPVKRHHAPSAWNEFLSREFHRNGGRIPLAALAQDPSIRAAYHNGSRGVAAPRRRGRAPRGMGGTYNYQLGGA